MTDTLTGCDLGSQKPRDATRMQEQDEVKLQESATTAGHEDFQLSVRLAVLCTV